MMQDWRLAEAKNRLSEVMNRALSEGPQRIVRRNDTVIILAESDYEKLAGKKAGFKDFLMQGPGIDDLELLRDGSPMRECKL